MLDFKSSISMQIGDSVSEIVVDYLIKNFTLNEGETNAEFYYLSIAVAEHLFGIAVCEDEEVKRYKGKTAKGLTKSIIKLLKEHNYYRTAVKGDIEDKKMLYWCCITKMVAVLKGSAKRAGIVKSEMLDTIEQRHKALMLPLICYKLGSKVKKNGGTDGNNGMPL